MDNSIIRTQRLGVNKPIMRFIFIFLVTILYACNGSHGKENNAITIPTSTFIFEMNVSAYHIKESIIKHCFEESDSLTNADCILINTTYNIIDSIGKDLIVFCGGIDINDGSIINGDNDQYSIKYFSEIVDLNRLVEFRKKLKFLANENDTRKDLYHLMINELQYIEEKIDLFAREPVEPNKAVVILLSAKLHFISKLSTEYL